MKASRTYLLFLTGILALVSCGPSKSVKTGSPPMVITTNPEGAGPAIEVTAWKGKAYHHALTAIWIEDSTGQYIQTLYVARSIASGIFGHGDKSSGVWEPGPIRRPAALPYWSHKRGIKAPDGLYTPSPEQPVPDAYSGATPNTDFIIESRADSILPSAYHILLEINQPWDWNAYWTNNKFPDDDDYRNSAQPSLVYRAELPTQEGRVRMQVIGRGHHSGDDGVLYTDLETMTTSLQIIDSVFVKVR